MAAPAKPDAKENPPVPAAKAGPEKTGGDKATGTAAPAPAAKPGGFSVASWIPAILAIVLAPAASWAVAQYALMPVLQKKLAESSTAEGAPAAAAASPSAPAGKGGKAAADQPPPTYKFDNVVVNLAGTMGTRYLKATFLVTGSDPNLEKIFTEKNPQLMDVTINVLSSLTLADLEEPGSKNLLREKLVAEYNQTLGRKVVDQIYFSEFVVQ